LNKLEKLNISDILDKIAGRARALVEKLIDKLIDIVYISGN